MTQTERMPAGQTAKPAPDHGKWQVLDDLREVAAASGIGPTVLRTLQVLIGFIRPERGDFTVFAANRSICDRLMGVSERTVQRHVRLLEAAGLLRREDSASGRRFRQADATCFGLSLRPLYERAALIADAAAAEQARRQALRDSRRRLMARLYRSGIAPDDCAALAHRLRRAATAAAQAEIAALLPALPDPAPLPDPDKMTPAPRQDAVPIQNTENESESVSAAQNDALPLAQVLEACPEVRATFGESPATWHDAVAMAAQIARFVGIGPQGWQAALQRMGRIRSATALFVMLQRLPLIRQPAAYLHGLVSRDIAGRLNLRAQVLGLLRPRAMAS